MSGIRDFPIRRKLVIIAMTASVVSLIVAGISIVAAESFLFRDYLKGDLAALIRIVGENSTAALAFNDPDAAAQALGTLRERVHVSAACIYRMDNTVLARYEPRSGLRCPPPETGSYMRPEGDFIHASEPILLKGQRMGTIVLLYDLGEVGERGALYSAVVIAFLILASVIAYALASRLQTIVATPIARLVEATTSVSATGAYDIHVQKMSRDELGVLTDRFNEMLAGIRDRENALRAAVHDIESERERFRFLAESMPQKIFTASPEGGFDYLNAQWHEFAGQSCDEMKNWKWIQFVHPDDLEETLRAWKHSLETGEPFHFEHRFRRADGFYRWHLSRARAMRSDEGGIAMWIGSTTDIHEQKEREQELRRVNEDLQQFAYSASHDLQEPIRNVAVYSEIVAARYGAMLDADGMQFLGFIKEGGRRLATLVDALLAYTRATMMELTETRVRSAAVLEAVASNLTQAMREANAVVTSGPLPEVFIGEAHLHQLFQNLIANAVKYRSNEEPRVHVSAELLGDYWRFAVRDNGIGIDPQYKEKIFGIFKRLHHDKSYSGTGIGLAICHRIVLRYGGRIWVESELGKGSVFYFTVPVRSYRAGPAAMDSAAG